jgi:drug/metabolite transporter (DMT)-like permease
MTAVDGAAPAARRPAPRQGLATLLILFSACCFGVIATFARLAYDGGSNPLTLVLLRHGALVLVVLLLILATRRSLHLSRANLVATLWMGLCLLAMACGFMGAVAYIPVSLAALILYTNPLMVALMATALRREPMTAGKAGLLLGAFIGLCLALGPPLTTLHPVGLGLAFMAAVGVSLAYIFGGPLLRQNDVFAINFYTNLWIVLPVGAYLLLAGGFALPHTALGQFGAAAAIAASVTAIVTWFVSLRLASPVRIAVLFNLDAVVNILAGVFVLHESLDAVQIGGIAVVLTCLVAMALRRSD